MFKLNIYKKNIMFKYLFYLPPGAEGKMIMKEACDVKNFAILSL